MTEEQGQERRLRLRDVGNAAVLLVEAVRGADSQSPVKVQTRRGDATVYIDGKGADVQLSGVTVHVRQSDGAC